MNEPVSAREQLLTMLTDISDQLEELESVIETSFSDLRSIWWHEELQNLAEPKLRISYLEARLQNDLSFTLADAVHYKHPTPLKLEMGY